MKLPVIIFAAFVIGCKSPATLRWQSASEVQSAGLEKKVETRRTEDSLRVSANRVKDTPLESRDSTDVFDRDKILTEIIGSSVDSAERLARFHGNVFRVVKQNGVGLPFTADIRSDRLSVEIVDEKVVATSWD